MIGPTASVRTLKRRLLTPKLNHIQHDLSRSAMTHTRNPARPEALRPAARFATLGVPATIASPPDSDHRDNRRVTSKGPWAHSTSEPH